MVFLNPLPAPLHDGLDGVHPKQGHILLEHGIVEHVHVGVVEAGQDHGSLEIPLLVPALGQGLRGGAQVHQLVSLRSHGLIAGHGPVHGHDLAVIPKSSHIFPSFPALRQILYSIFAIFMPKPVNMHKKPPEPSVPQGIQPLLPS